MTLTRALARPAVAATALACIATLALAGCTDQPKDTANRAPASTSSSPEPSESVEESPTETATTESTASTDPEPSATASPDPSGALRDRLLPASELPGFNEEYRWSAGATRDQEPTKSFGTCQRFGMSSIGATDVAVRTYRPADKQSRSDQGGELVAEFPDSATARRAFAVLTSWRKKCADQLSRYDSSEVGKLENVSVPGGTGGWYLLTYGPVPGDPDAGYFDAQGMAVVGSRIAMVELILAGQDYNYEAGQEPMVTAVQRAAARLS